MPSQVSSPKRLPEVEFKASFVPQEELKVSFKCQEMDEHSRPFYYFTSHLDCKNLIILPFAKNSNSYFVLTLSQY